MAKAGLLFAGTTDGLALYSEPGAMGRWLRIETALSGRTLVGVWAVPANPLHVVAGGAHLWRSEDGGQQWQIADAQPVAALSGAGPCVVVAFASGALAASSDGGDTWQAATAPWGTATPLLCGATRGTRVLAAAGATIWQTATGTDWQTLDGAPGDVAALAATDTETVALVGDTIWRLGSGWQMQGNAPAGTPALALLAGSTPTLLAAHPGGISASTDFGQHWQGIPDAPVDVSVLAPAPYHVDTLFAGTSTGQVFVSTDRGQTWRALRSGTAAVTAIAAGRLI